VGFPITFQEAGESNPLTTAYNTGSTDVWVTPGTPVYTGPVADSTEKWCFDFSCNNQTVSVGSATKLSYYYYDLLAQSTSINTVNGGSPTVNLSYIAPPSSAGGTDTTQSKNLPLSKTVQVALAVRGSKALVPTCSPATNCGSNGERW